MDSYPVRRRAWRAMNDRATPFPQSSARPRELRRAWAILGSSLLLAALAVPGAASATPAPDGAAARSREPVGAGAGALGVPASIALDQRVGGLNRPVFI